MLTLTPTLITVVCLLLLWVYLNFTLIVHRAHIAKRVNLRLGLGLGLESGLEPGLGVAGVSLNLATIF